MPAVQDPDVPATEQDQAIKKFLNKQNDDATQKEERKVPEEDEVASQVESCEYPSHQWFLRFRESLVLQNIKISIQHTYSKAMQFRNQMID